MPKKLEHMVCEEKTGLKQSLETTEKETLEITETTETTEEIISREDSTDTEDLNDFCKLEDDANLYKTKYMFQILLSNVKKVLNPVGRPSGKQSLVKYDKNQKRLY